MSGEENWMYLNVNEETLDKYRGIPHKHNVTNPLMYREELVSHFQGDPNKKGLAMPWEQLEGFRVRPGEVTVAAAANFAGKSALMGQCATQWMREDTKILLISPEFSPATNLSRIVQQVCGKQPADITEADVTAVLIWLEGRMMVYDAIGQIEVEDICAVSHYAAEELGVTMVILDNLTVLKLVGETNTAQGELMTDLIQTARTTGLHIFVVAHTRKPQSGEEFGRYSIRGASQISDLADNVIMIERNERKEKLLADINTTEEERKEIRYQSDTKVRIGKQRHGSAATPTAKLYFSPISMRWYEGIKYVDRPFNEVVDMASLGGNHVRNGTV
jgi:twinkle protein